MTTFSPEQIEAYANAAAAEAVALIEILSTEELLAFMRLRTKLIEEARQTCPTVAALIDAGAAHYAAKMGLPAR